MSPLAIIGQDDFAAGVIRGPAPDVMPGFGVANAINGLYNDDGDVYRRGGFVQDSVSAGSVGPITLLWTGFLNGFPKVLIGDSAGVYTIPTLGWAGAYTTLSATAVQRIQRPAVVADRVYLPNGVVWGGSTSNNYVAGTAALTAGSDIAIGTGTLWVTNVEAGQFLMIAGSYYRIVTVLNNTQLKLDRPALANVATTAYTISRVANWTRPAAVANANIIRLATIAGRLVVAGDNKLAFSEGDAPWSFIADDFHSLPGGVQIMGLAAIRDTLLVFTNFGLWSVTNMAYDLTDAAGNIQQTLSLVTPEVSLWQEAGLCEWAGRIVAPCLDKIFVVDTLSLPVDVTASIAPDYHAFIDANRTLGGCKVFNNHLFMPVLDNAKAGVALYVCRLDRPVQGRQLYFPWSTFTDYALTASVFDVALIGTRPQLLGAQPGRTLSDYAWVFKPDATHALDNGHGYPFDVETRDFPTGNGQPNHVRKLRLRYTMEGAAQVLAGYSYGSVAQSYEHLLNTSIDYADVKADYATYLIVFRGLGFVPGGLPPSPDDPSRFWYTLYDQTPADPGVDPVTWQFPQAVRQRFMRFRFRSEDAPARLVLHHMDFHVRSATHDR